MVYTEKAIFKRDIKERENGKKTTQIRDSTFRVTEQIICYVFEKTNDSSNSYTKW